MKQVLLSGVFMTLSLVAMAQLPNGSIAPDWTRSDIGHIDSVHEHTLYNYLDSGKSVIIDLMAAWCPPCWFYHDDLGHLKTMHNQFGPNGTDQMEVFMIEGQGDNTLAQLQGVNAGTTRATATEGDWVTGTPYPIIDDATLNTPYALRAYPTIYIIRPDRRTYHGQSVVAFPEPGFLEYLAFNTEANDASFHSSMSIAADNCGDLIVNSSIINFGTTPLTTADFLVTQGTDSVTTYTWNGMLMPFQEEGLTFGLPTFVDGTLINVNIVSANGMPDGNATFSSFTDVAVDNKVVLDSVIFSIRTDFWPDEISWNFTDGSGTIIKSSSELGPLSCDTEYSQTVVFQQGDCVSFNIIDGYGDGIFNGQANPASHSCTTPNGMASTSMGAVALISGSGTLLFNNVEYDAGTSVQFEAQVTNVATTNISYISGIAVYPNPTSDILNLEMNSEENAEVELSVRNTNGQMVKQFNRAQISVGQNFERLDVSDLKAGVYMLEVREDKKVTVEKFVKF